MQPHNGQDAPLPASAWTLRSGTAMCHHGLLLCLFLGGVILPETSPGQEIAPGTGPAAEEPAQAEPVPQRNVHTYDLIYVGDSFSFVGRDDRGRVAFSLENNRGRDGTEWQAEHVAVLHAEGEGWIDLEGVGPYSNRKMQLLEIPESDAFRYEGGSAFGYIITSEPNDLVLRIGPVTEHLSRAKDAAKYRMGTAGGVLAWGDRVLEGRVIYERLLVPEFNRLNRVYVGVYKDFQGFYALTETGGDFYLHSQREGRLAPLVGTVEGVLAADGTVERLNEASVKVLSREMALGTYRWPTQWRIEWENGNGPRQLELTLSDQHVVDNWVVGGFAVGIVSGTLSIGTRSESVYGLAQLFM